MKKWAWIPVVALLIYVWEAGSQFDLRTRPWVKRDALQSHSEVDELKNLLTSNKKSLEDYNAIWGLPSALLGPEIIQLQRGHYFMNLLMPLSYQSGLPMVNWMMSRTSLSQTMDYLELFTPSFVKKKRLTQMEDSKLLIMYREDHCAKYEIRVAQKASEIGSTKNAKWLELSANDLYNAGVRDSLLNWVESKPQGHAPFDHLSFNEDANESFAGGGSKWLEDEELIWTGRIPTGRIYECSFWVKLNAASKSLPRIKFRKMNTEGKVLYESQYDFMEQAVAQNEWLRVEWSFDTEGATDIFEIWCESEGLYVDELVVHPKEVNTVHYSGDDVLYRNFRL